MAHATWDWVLFPLDDAETRRPPSRIKRALHEPVAALCCNNKAQIGEFARDPMVVENRGYPRRLRARLSGVFSLVTFFAHTKKVTGRAGADARVIKSISKMRVQEPCLIKYY